LPGWGINKKEGESKWFQQTSVFFQAYHNEGIMSTQQLLVLTDCGANMDVLPLEPEKRKKRRRKNMSEECDQKTKRNEEKGQTSFEYDND